MPFLKFKKIIILFFIFSSFLGGFFLRHIKPSYLVFIKYQFEKIIFKYNKTDKYKTYCPPLISDLPEKSILIIGHAYGSPKQSELRGNNGIAPKVNEFYINNKKNIDAIIFNGDVLISPTIKKWKNFYSNFSKDLKIYISPGNHDVGIYHDSAKRDIFNLIVQKKENQKKFPFRIEINDSIFIIADSNAKENTLKKIISIIDKEKTEKNIYIIHHHIIPEGLSFASNGNPIQGFTENSFFKNKFKEKEKNKVTFIYGDGGGTHTRPRVACLNLYNSSHIVSGIGEIKGDTIFIISNKRIYRMEI